LSRAALRLPCFSDKEGLRQQRGDDWLVDHTGYHPSTKGGKQHAREKLADDIKCHLLGANEGDLML